MLVKRLVPGSFYWARSKFTGSETTIVQVSSVFGEDDRFWTLVTCGSDEHHMPSDFDIIARIDEPERWSPTQLAAE